MLGSGCFSDVRELRMSTRNVLSRSESTRSIGSMITISTTSPTDEALDQSTSPQEPPDGSHCYTYAVKKLREGLSGSIHRSGVIDLAVEAQFLTTLSHPNIVSLKGMGTDPGSKDFFIIIDRLERTLSQEIKAWKTQRRRVKEQGLHCGASKKDLQIILQSHLDDHISYAHHMASALKYLHKKNVIFRDLKPENIGIDDDDNLKIFDFGLAKELKEEHRAPGLDQYHASIAGTRRYMPPEVASGAPYGLPADIFSFVLILWEMMSLKQPFKEMTSENHKLVVYQLRIRPSIERGWPREMKDLLRSGWSHDPRHRPDVTTVFDIIGTYLTLKEKKVACA